MVGINFKVFGLTQPGFEHAGSGLEPTIFGLLDFLKQEGGRSTHLANPTGPYKVWVMKDPLSR